MEDCAAMDVLGVTIKCLYARTSALLQTLNDGYIQLHIALTEFVALEGKLRTLKRTHENNLVLFILFGISQTERTKVLYF